MKNKKLCIFDFDDTLIHSGEHKIVVHRQNGIVEHLTSKEWAKFEPRPGDKYDLSQFDHLKNPKKIDQTWKIFLDRLWTVGYDHVFVLSARGDHKPLEKYFDHEGIRVQVVCLGIPPGANNGAYKMSWIENKMLEGDYNKVEFLDDRKDCVEHVKTLRSKHPSKKIDIWQVDEGEMTYVD